MKLSSQIKPISYLKAHAAEIVRTLGDQPEPLIITQNGEAKAVMQDIDSYEQMQETVALLKILALGSRQIEAGQVQPAADVVARLRERRQGSLMAFLVQLTDDATRDLEEICDYIDRHDEPGRADYVLEQIEKAFSSLSEYPERGNYPAELLDIGIREYREIFSRPYRIIYRVMENNVYVLLIADGRRDMQTLLQRRLLWA